MRGDKLAIRARTTMFQKLSEEFDEKLQNLEAFFNKEVGDHNCIHSRIINTDEVPLTFDIPVRRTVAQKGEKTDTENDGAREIALRRHPCVLRRRHEGATNGHFQKKNHAQRKLSSRPCLRN